MRMGCPGLLVHIACIHSSTVFPTFKANVTPGAWTKKLLHSLRRPSKGSMRLICARRGGDTTARRYIFFGREPALTTEPRPNPLGIRPQLDTGISRGPPPRMNLRLPKHPHGKVRELVHFDFRILRRPVQNHSFFNEIG